MAAWYTYPKLCMSNSDHACGFWGSGVWTGLTSEPALCLGAGGVRQEELLWVRLTTLVSSQDCAFA